MDAERVSSSSGRNRLVALILFGLLVMAVMVVKSFSRGWFEPRTPVALSGQPTLVFVTLADGCECQMIVIRNAEAQLAEWPFMQTGTFSLQRVDYSRRPDLVIQYDVARAPALVLLNSAGEVVWKQDLGLSDEAPLDLDQAKTQIEILRSGESQ